jgi:hypothetical protein
MGCVKPALPPATCPDWLPFCPIWANCIRAIQSRLVRKEQAPGAERNSSAENSLGSLKSTKNPSENLSRFFSQNI